MTGQHDQSKDGKFEGDPELPDEEDDLMKLAPEGNCESPEGKEQDDE